jgi:serine protease Do
MKTCNRIAPQWVALIVVLLVGLACLPTTPTEIPKEVEATPTSWTPPEPQPTEPAGPTPQERDDLMFSTVQIFGLYIIEGKYSPIYSGSGTLLSKDGLILTNAHVASPPEVGDDLPAPDALGIAIVVAEDKPAEPAYFAEVLAIDGYLDLAVLQITETLDGKRVDTSELNLPYVDLGDSDEIHIGDRLNVFGFPGIGGDTITYTQGTVAGFASDEEIGDRSWIKTDATISGGNSGGLGADDDNSLIGVPTAIGAGTGVKGSDCRPSQDTNGDGKVDRNDYCVPVSNFISELRPVNLAKPLIQAVKANIPYVSPYGPVIAGAVGTGNESFGPVSWYTVSNSEGCETGKRTDSYPSGTKGIAAVTEYSGMTPGQEWGIIWTIDGEVVANKKDSWDAEESGSYSNCLVSTTNEALPDGTYTVAIFAGPKLPLLSEGEVVIGTGAAPTQPTGKGEIQLSGTVYDEATSKPIPGAAVWVLKTGITFKEWADADFPESDVFTWNRTDSKGYYVMPDKLLRNTPYTIVAAAKGYLPAAGDNMVWNNSAPANFVLDIGLSE